MKLFQKIVVLGIVMIFIAGCGKNMLVMPTSSETYMGKDYEAIVAELQNIGFANVTISEIADLTIENIDLDRLVTQVAVNGVSMFDMGAEFEAKSNVVVTYHTIMKAAPGISGEGVVGNQFEELVKKFGEAGFCDVTVEPVEDIVAGSSEQEGSVIKVIIGEKDAFAENEEFPINTKVVISYHTKVKINPPVASNKLGDVQYVDLKKKFEAAGFVNVKVEAIEDLITGWLTQDGEVDSVIIDGNTVFGTEDNYPFDAEIIIYYHTFSGNDNGNDKAIEVTNK